MEKTKFYAKDQYFQESRASFAPFPQNMLPSYGWIQVSQSHLQVAETTKKPEVFLALNSPWSSVEAKKAQSVLIPERAVKQT